MQIEMSDSKNDDAMNSVRTKSSTAALNKIQSLVGWAQKPESTLIDQTKQTPSNEALVRLNFLIVRALR
jgi:hypothetical protein